MEKAIVDFEKYLNFHKEFGGTGKLFKFKFLEYKKGFLKLEAEFTSTTLNPNQTVQGGQMNSMLDDVTSLLIIYESQGNYYPSSTNLHSIHHRPLFAGKVIATAEVIKTGKKIASIKGELFSKEGKIATTLIHTAVLVKAKSSM
ncbi:MAG: PaaI family thioesterase [Flavobacteriales bacterium]|nr:PaaI family thioesterase [Flavobacteriaceae bacterium]